VLTCIPMPKTCMLNDFAESRAKFYVLTGKKNPLSNKLKLYILMVIFRVVFVAGARVIAVLTLTTSMPKNMLNVC
jgi:hypothetical protein